MNKVVLLLLISILSSCTVQQSVSLQPENPGDVQVILTEFLTKSYTEVALVESQGSEGISKSYLIDKLKKRAKKYTADAIISIQFDYGNDGTIYASAVAIKYN